MPRPLTDRVLGVSRRRRQLALVALGAAYVLLKPALVRTGALAVATTAAVGLVAVTT